MGYVRADDFQSRPYRSVFRDFDDTLGTADEDGPGKAFAWTCSGSLQDAAAFRFRQDDFLSVFGNAAFQVIG